MTTRRKFLQGAAGATGLAMLGPVQQAWAKDMKLNILCWEGYNSPSVLNPFRYKHPDIQVNAEAASSDPKMINKLRAGGTNVWDVININQPWARKVLWPDKLIRPLDKGRFAPYQDQFLPRFQNYKYAYSESGDEYLGVTQRFGPFNFVVNTDKISRDMAEDQGWNLFFDKKLKGRYGILAYDNWNLIHLCLAAGLNPFEKLDGDEQSRFKETAQKIVANAKLRSQNLVQLNMALINGSIDAYFTGGTYSASPARLAGFSNIRGITPNSGPIDGKGGIVWVEVNSAVNNPNQGPWADDFLEYIQQPKVCHNVAFAEGTYNPVAQMGNPDVLAQFSKEELQAIQWETLSEDLDRCYDHLVVASYDDLVNIYSGVKRG